MSGPRFFFADRSPGFSTVCIHDNDAFGYLLPTQNPTREMGLKLNSKTFFFILYLIFDDSSKLHREPSAHSTFKNHQKVTKKLRKICFN